MHISPEESGTARDAALNAGLQHLPALDAASANRQLESSTLMLLGHSSGAAAPQGAEGKQQSMGFATDMLGGVADSSDSMIDDLLSDVDSPESSLDSFSAPQDWNVPPTTTADGPLSALQSLDDPSTFGPDELSAPAALLPTALAPSTSPTESPLPSSTEGQGFLAAENSSVSGSTDNPQSNAGDGEFRTAHEANADGGSGRPSSAAVSGGGQSGSVVSVTLIDRQQVLAEATANVAALAKAAARSTAAIVVDQRLSDLRTADDAQNSARAAVFGS